MALTPHQPGWDSTRSNEETQHSLSQLLSASSDCLWCLISFLHLLWSSASDACKSKRTESLWTTSVLVFLGLPLGRMPSTSYAKYLLTKSPSSFLKTCRYLLNLFHRNLETISRDPNYLSVQHLNTCLSDVPHTSIWLSSRKLKSISEWICLTIKTKWWRNATVSESEKDESDAHQCACYPVNDRKLFAYKSITWHDSNNYSTFLESMLIFYQIIITLPSH